MNLKNGTVDDVSISNRPRERLYIPWRGMKNGKGVVVVNNAATLNEFRLVAVRDI